MRRNKFQSIRVDKAWQSSIRPRKFFKAVETVETVAVDKMNIEITEGELFGLLGPNGAGKTTTIRTLATSSSLSGRLPLR